MSKLEAQFGKADYEILSRENGFRGFLNIDIINVKHKLFRGGWSSTINREVLVREGAVGVLLFDPQRDEIILVRQFRVGLLDWAATPWALELIAGMIEFGEELEEVAFREVKEESNCEVSQLVKICDYYNSPGVSSEKVRLYLGIVDSENMGGIYGLESENEDIEVVVLSYTEAITGLNKGYLANAMSIIALQWLELNKSHILQKF
ncbi:MAG: ADP-ribose pyrophosphatase [Chloroflexota bacterium]|nr:MAG: ADP-ribose pyrophosphatase [Chloroflexota bacterium]